MSALYREELDPSKKAGDVLAYVLNEEMAVDTDDPQPDSASVVEELSSASLVAVASSRTESRVLFLTRDISVLHETSPVRAHMRTIASVFDEVHVVVLATVYEAKGDTLRDGKNLWIYTTGADNTLDHYFAALRLMKEHMVFSEGFRPDIIVALEPYVSGVIGLWIAHKYERPFQIHVQEDFLADEFLTTHTHGAWMRRIALYTLHRASSVCASDQLSARLQKVLPKDVDIRVLPKFMNIQALAAQGSHATEKDLFPSFSFVIVFVGKLDAESTLFRAIDAARSALYSKSIGLAVVGDGPLRDTFQKRAAILGIQEQVVFFKDVRMVPEVLSQADILIATDDSEISDEVVIQAAARKVPLLVAENKLRKELFTDGVDAFLCPKEDTVCFSQKLIKFLNGSSLRIQFAHNAYEVVTSRLTEDPLLFAQAYKNAIESTFQHEDGA